MGTSRFAATIVFASFIVSLVAPHAALASSPYEPEWEVDAKKTVSLTEASKLVTDLLDGSTIKSKEFFCFKNDLICRVHYTLADKSGNLIAPFFVRFIAADRSVAAQGYFFPVVGQPDTFIRFEDFTFDGKVNIDQVVSENLTKVEKSKTGQVTAIHGSVLPKLGTSRYTEAEVTVSATSVVLEGTQKDKNDPTFLKHVRDEYLRTNLTD